MSYALELVDLTKNYGKVSALADVNMVVEAGEIFGFIGPNGAGKTTTMRLLLGLLRPTSGEARLFGRVVPTRGGKTLRRVGYLPAEVKYYPEMTGRDVLEYAFNFYRTGNRSWIEELVDRLQFDPDKKVHSYSHGNRKKLGIIQALAHRPQLLLLDEPGSGLDPLVRIELFKILEELNRGGVTIFFSTHTLDEVERICHRVAMINNGRLVHIGPVDRLPGRDLKVITLKFSRQAATRVTLARIGRAEELPARPGFFRIISRLSINELVSQLSSFDLDYLRITNPSLEEVFLYLYETTRGRGESSVD